jgi:hypothetical protein
MKLRKLTEIMQVRGVRVYAHWSVLLIGTLVSVRRARTASLWKPASIRQLCACRSDAGRQLEGSPRPDPLLTVESVVPTENLVSANVTTCSGG